MIGMLQTNITTQQQYRQRAIGWKDIQPSSKEIKRQHTTIDHDSVVLQHIQIIASLIVNNF